MTLADLGAHPVHAHHPTPAGPNSFVFAHVFAKKPARLHPAQILEPPLDDQGWSHLAQVQIKVFTSF